MGASIGAIETDGHQVDFRVVGWRPDFGRTAVPEPGAVRGPRDRRMEADTRREKTERDPLILLDDVFAELDRPRSLRILELLEAEQPGQVVLTAPKESDLELRRGQLEHWRIAAGRILQ